MTTLNILPTKKWFAIFQESVLFSEPFFGNLIPPSVIVNANVQMELTQGSFKKQKHLQNKYEKLNNFEFIPEKYFGTFKPCLTTNTQQLGKLIIIEWILVEF